MSKKTLAIFVFIAITISTSVVMINNYLKSPETAQNDQFEPQIDNQESPIENFESQTIVSNQKLDSRSYMNSIVDDLLSETSLENIQDTIDPNKLSPKIKKDLVQSQKILFRKALNNDDYSTIQETIYVMSLLEPETFVELANDYFVEFNKKSSTSDDSRITRAFIIGNLITNKDKVNISRAIELFQTTCKTPNDCRYERGMLTEASL